MLKKQITKLFAVATLVASAPAFAEAPRTLENGRPACGNTTSKGGDNCDMRAAEDARIAREKRIADARTARRAALVAAQTSAAAKAVSAARVATNPVRQRIAIAPTAPVIQPTAPAMVRTLPNGSPACGNVASKGPRRACDTVTK